MRAPFDMSDFLRGAWPLIMCALCIALLWRGAIIAFYRKWFLQGPMWDSALHFAVIETLRRDGRYAGVPQFLMHDEPDTYPIAFHRFAALFPDSVLRRHLYLPSLLVFGAGVAMFALCLAYVDTRYLGGSGGALTIVSLAFFLNTVSAVVHNGNAVLYLGLSERLLARFLSALFFLLLVCALSFDDLVLFSIAALVGALIGITSMFGRQTIWFVLPVFALLLWDWRPLAVLAAAMLGSLLLDRGYYVRGLRHMYTFWQTYTRISKHSRYVKSSLSRYVNWRAVASLKAGLNAWLQEIESHEPTQLLFRFPEIFLLLAFFVMDRRILIPAIGALIVASVIVYALTTTRYLRQFGEAVRYLEYCLWLVVPFQLALYVQSTSGVERSLFLSAYAVFCMAIFVRQALLWFRYPAPADDSLRMLLAPLALGPQHVLFPIPFTLGGSAAIRTNGSGAIMCQGAAITPDLYRKYCDETPLLKKDWDELFRKFRVTHVIALTSTLNLTRELVSWEYSFEGLVKVAEDQTYVVYARPDITAG